MTRPVNAAPVDTHHGMHAVFHETYTNQQLAVLKWSYTARKAVDNGCFAAMNPSFQPHMQFAAPDQTDTSWLLQSLVETLSTNAPLSQCSK